jgi:hypothetical protein
MEASFRGYEAEQDEVLDALANTDFLEIVESANGSSDEQDQNAQDQQAISQPQIPTPYQVEKSLKRPSADVMEIDPGSSSKKPRLVEIEEVVEIEDDEDRSTNQDNTTFVEEEGAQEQSKSISSAEKTISNPPVAEGSQVSAMVVQKYISSEEETSKVPS